MTLRRISIIGVSGSGKSTLANILSSSLNLPHIELDTFLYHENGTKKDPELFRKEIKQATKQDSWITEGVSYKMADIVWSRADIVIWMDPPLYMLYYRVLKRTLKRLLKNEPLPSGHPSSLKRELGKQGVLRNLRKIYKNIHKKYPKQFEEIGTDNLNMVHIKTKRELETFLSHKIRINNQQD